MKTQNKEQWRDIQGYEDIYQVSDQGRIKSLARITPHGRRRKERILKLQKNQYNYRVITLYRGSGPLMRLVHRLVLETFVGPCPENMECRHLDGNPTNNHLSNLRWGTRIENFADRHMHGTTCNGERNGFAKFCNLDVWLIRNCTGTNRQLADFFEVGISQIYRIRNRRAWKHI